MLGQAGKGEREAVRLKAVREGIREIDCPNSLIAYSLPKPYYSYL